MNINKPKRPWEYYYNEFMNNNVEKLSEAIDQHILIKISKDHINLSNFKKLGDWTWKDTGIPLNDLVNEC